MTGRMFSCEIIPAISCVLNWDTYLSDPDSSKKYWSIRNIIVRNYVHPLMGGEYNAPIVFLRVVWGNSKGVPTTARLQRGITPASCVTSTGMPTQNAATIIKPLVPNPHSTPFTHGAICCWLGCTIPLLLSSNPSILPLHPPPLLPSSRELGAIIIIIGCEPVLSKWCCRLKAGSELLESLWRVKIPCSRYYIHDIVCNNLSSK